MGDHHIPVQLVMHNWPMLLYSSGSFMVELLAVSVNV